MHLECLLNTEHRASSHSVLQADKPDRYLTWYHCCSREPPIAKCRTGLCLLQATLVCVNILLVNVLLNFQHWMANTFPRREDDGQHSHISSVSSPFLFSSPCAVVSRTVRPWSSSRYSPACKAIQTLEAPRQPQNLIRSTVGCTLTATSTSLLATKPQSAPLAQHEHK